ncbi:MAG: glycosyltransferase N-terminal domain-containing protein [Longimicrobiales bacterium]|nr:glycosyltransferase N-terminal domain-containing protein [Longimicrobiales bacterium]
MIRPLDAAYAALLGVSAPVWGSALLRTGKWRTDWRGRRGFAPVLPRDDRPTLLLHGVSVGEVVAAEPLVRRLEADGVRVVVSTTTDTGTDRARALYAPDHRVVRYPLDFSWIVSRFLDRVRPDAVGLLELEVWPHFTAECARRGIPVAVVNGRLGVASFRGYRRVRRVVAPSFSRLRAVAAQSELWARRFVDLGVPGASVQVTGSMKWDVDLPTDLAARARALRAELGIDPDRRVVVAVSTGPGEEVALLRHTPPDVTLVVVPRKPERFEEVARLAPWVRRSRAGAAGGGDLSGRRLFLLDTMGEAEVATALADVVVIGRSFNGMGGSNAIPAAALGRPIVIGPSHHNFTEVVEALRPASVEIATLAGLPGVLRDGDALHRIAEAGPAIVRARRGACERNAAILLDLLACTPHDRSAP